MPREKGKSRKADTPKTPANPIYWKQSEISKPVDWFRDLNGPELCTPKKSTTDVFGFVGRREASTSSSTWTRNWRTTIHSKPNSPQSWKRWRSGRISDNDGTICYRQKHPTVIPCTETSANSTLRPSIWPTSKYRDWMSRNTRWLSEKRRSTRSFVLYSEIWTTVSSITTSPLIISNQKPLIMSN